jgi:hypothetical protein
MSNGTPKSTGVDYGAIRADIDIEKLNAYLKTHVPVVIAPVEVQQFKVRPRPLLGTLRID